MTTLLYILGCACLGIGIAVIPVCVVGLVLIRKPEIRSDECLESRLMGK